MTVRFGIIGLGQISSRFAKVLQTVEDVELSSVASRDLDRTKKFANRFESQKSAATYEAVITDPEVDVVYIGLTHNFHYEYAKKCLEAHKPVLCEKPLVTTQKQAIELVNLAKKNNTLLMEAMWTRCMPAYIKAQEWVKYGRIGQVKLITANFSYRAPYDPHHRLFNKDTEGGSLYDVGIYPIDFAIGIVGGYPLSVTGSAHFAPNGVDESAAFSMKFEGGELANLACGFNVRAMEEAYIYGTQGRIVLENCFGPQTCILSDENGKTIEKFMKPVADGFEHQIRHCADLVRTGKIESDLIPWEDTIASTAIFDALNQQWGIC
ncbi:MAG: gfo/Idh/MocA family oxidoreductase [Chloroflexi bacterium HGW-Chloroflexi-4]|jgi:predicted dehydrogenase|nr:MAG: gfo/Idh/MocA family oxidoreductase [Chloroflexi bacterium HGW-Chloroflexi-4]